MAGRRIFFCLLVCGVLLFHVMTESYWGQFLLFLCAALPALSLLLSLRAMRGCRASLAALPPSLPLNTSGGWQIVLHIPGALPLARVDVRCSEENLLLGKTHPRRARLACAADGACIALPADTAHCGLLELRAQRIVVCDLLGLFRRRLPPPEPARMACLPIPAGEMPPLIARDGPVQAVRTGAAPAGAAEDYDLRGYRPGDPIRTVHWKLSTKWDSLIVREPLQTSAALPLLTLDRFGTADVLDTLLGRLSGLSRALLSAQQPHTVLWLDAAGQPCQYDITDEQQRMTCLLALLGSAAPQTGSAAALDTRPELWEHTGRTVVRVRAEPEGGGADA